MKSYNEKEQKIFTNSKLTGYSAIGAVFVAVGLMLIALLNWLLPQQIEPEISTPIASPALTSTLIPTPMENPTPATFESMTPSLSRSIVRITAREKGNFTVPETGTGIVISEDGLIITNSHVVMNGNVDNQIIVTFTIGDRKIEKYAYIKGIMPCDDIALLDVQGNDYIPIPSSPITSVGLGSEVFLLGYGHGTLITDDFSLRFAQGTVSRPKTSFSPFPMLIEHSIALLPADSGSPLFDRSGQLIGINFAMDIRGRGGNIAYAIDYQRVKELLPLLIDQKPPKPNYILDTVSQDLTITPITPQVRRLVDYFDRHCHTVNLTSNRDLIVRVEPQDSQLFRPEVTIYDWRNQLYIPPTELKSDNDFTLVGELILNGIYTVVVSRVQTTTTGADKLGDYTIIIHQKD